MHKPEDTCTEADFLPMGHDDNELAEARKEIARLRFLVTQARHVLMKKKLITFDEIKNWKV